MGDHANWSRSARPPGATRVLASFASGEMQLTVEDDASMVLMATRHNRTAAAQSHPPLSTSQRSARARPPPLATRTAIITPAHARATASIDGERRLQCAWRTHSRAPMVRRRRARAERQQSAAAWRGRPRCRRTSPPSRPGVNVTVRLHRCMTRDHADSATLLRMDPSRDRRRAGQARPRRRLRRVQSLILSRRQLRYAF